MNYPLYRAAEEHAAILKKLRIKVDAEKCVIITRDLVQQLPRDIKSDKAGKIVRDAIQAEQDRIKAAQQAKQSRLF